MNPILVNFLQDSGEETKAPKGCNTGSPWQTKMSWTFTFSRVARYKCKQEDIPQRMLKP